MDEQSDIPIKTDEKPIKDEAGLFLPGNPGGPGRPKKENTFSDIARTLLSSNEIKITYKYKKDGEVKDGCLDITSDNTINHSLVAALIKEGMDGNVKAIQELIDRTEGKAAQSINLGGQKDNQLPSSEVDKKLLTVLDSIIQSENEKQDENKPVD
jgi:hypothetical protein